MTTGVMNTLGYWTGLYDRNRRKIHIGDTIEFDPSEWGGPNSTVVEFKDGELNMPGAISEASEWCTVTVRYDE